MGTGGNYHPTNERPFFLFFMDVPEYFFYLDGLLKLLEFGDRRDLDTEDLVLIEAGIALLRLDGMIGTMSVDVGECVLLVVPLGWVGERQHREGECQRNGGQDRAHWYNSE